MATLNFEKILPILAFLVLFNSIESVIVPKLIFHSNAGTQMEIARWIPDMTMDANLMNFLPSIVRACYIGVWRIYPQVNYLNNAGVAGATFFGRASATEGCSDVSGYGSYFATLRSMRPLGPGPSGLDLDVNSLTMYPELYGAGQPQVIKTVDFANNPIPNPMSYFITSPTLNPPVPSIYNLFASPTCETTLSNRCISLSNPAASPARFYYEDDTSAGPELRFACIKFLPDTTTCDPLVDPVLLPPAAKMASQENSTMVRFAPE